MTAPNWTDFDLRGFAELATAMAQASTRKASGHPLVQRECCPAHAIEANFVRTHLLREANEAAELAIKLYDLAERADAADFKTPTVDRGHLS
ncbi:hypothetical protein [Rhodococcus ruber]|uniref:hypothetical protein n=1 Tax=Rhodococcus ruber TaxID=1830 RepID=UPI003782F4A0